MKPQEFRTQIFKTKDQWESGLFYRLCMEKDNGITLYSAPTFTRWIDELDGKIYLFCWDRIREDDEYLLKKFLIQNFCIDWVKTAKIEKIDNDRTIRVFFGKNYLLLSLNNEKTKVNLKIDEYTYELIAKTENYKLNIYAKINPVAIALDECRQIYFIDAVTCRFYRYPLSEIQKLDEEKASKRSEIISCLGGCGPDSGKFSNPKKMIFDKFTLWVLDTGNERLQAFSRENYQIKYILDKYKEEKLKNPIDFVLDKEENLYILDLSNKEGIEKTVNNEKENIDKEVSGSFKILKYDNHCIEKDFDQTDLKELNKPIGLAIDKENILYVLDKNCKEPREDGSSTCILKFSEDGKKLGSLGNLKIAYEDKEPRDFTPAMMTVDKKGNIFITEYKNGLIHQFAPDGSYIGTIQIPNSEDEITGIAIDSKGNLYASSNKGIALFSTQKVFTKERGCYYSKMLDSGKEKCQWHGLSLEGNIPPKAIIEIWYHSSDNPIKTDVILSDSKKSIKEKKESIDHKIPKWIGPEILSNLSKPRKEKADSVDEGIPRNEQEKTRLNMLFREKTGRYLWLKISLSTFDEKVTPSVAQMKVLYPRNSYLRYLPAIYQKDPIRKDFLERFLSIFETVFYDLESKISDIFKYFDPETAESKYFLSWLASWLNLVVEEEWDDARKRKFIHEAYALYKLKGTPSGLERLIEIYIGKKPLILEHSRIGKPIVLREKREQGAFALGIDSLLLRTPIRGFRLGEDSILGRVALIDGDLSRVLGNPFLSLAHRFTVIIDIPDKEFALHEKVIKRILDREKPAHTMYHLRIAGEMKGSTGLNVEVNARMADQGHFSLGENSIIGSSILAMSEEHSGKVEHHSRLEKDTNLI